LPALALAVTTAPSTFQVTRSATIEIMKSDYIRSARAFGMSRLTIYRYALKNMLGPIVTMVTMTYGFLISGTVLIEVVFAWPGLGLYAVDAMNRSDYEPVMGVVLFSTAFYMVLYILADLINSAIDPRARLNR
jgi:peptide/nickel transport system permease protein